MNFLASLLSGGNAVESISHLIDDSFLSKEERLEMEISEARDKRKYDFEYAKLIADQNVAQTEVNKAEAAIGNIFIAGWRPAIGWVGALALIYQFILYPLLLWLPVETPPPPQDYTMLFTLITGMLGIGVMRSYDKVKGVDTKSMGKSQ